MSGSLSEVKGVLCTKQGGGLQINVHADRQAGWLVDGEAGRQASRHIERQTDSQTRRTRAPQETWTCQM